MSRAASQSTPDDANVELFEDFLRQYYREDVLELANHYPSEQQSLYVDAADVFEFNAGLLDDWLDEPGEFKPAAEEALANLDLPVEVDLSDATIRLIDSGSYIPTVSVNEIRSAHLGQYVGVDGHLSKVTGSKPRVTTAAFECKRCGTMTRVGQGRFSTQEPHECAGCERAGPFQVDLDQSAFVDQRKMKIEEPPDERADSEGLHIMSFAERDLAEEGGSHGLADRSGEHVTAYGVLRLDQSSLLDNRSAPEGDPWLDTTAIEFEQDGYEDIDVEAHRDEFERLAARDDAIDLVADSIAPGLHRNGDLDAITVASVAWLFNAYRIDNPGGETYRGDLHMGIIGDPGLGKSSLLNDLHTIAPQSEFRSGTNLSGVGLTAAAVQEEFAGTTEWALEPGVLPRANGGHCIIDEIDAVVGEDAKKMHDAIEQEQMVKVDKAGIKADLPTRTAVAVSGNPEYGRFDGHEPIVDQVDMDPALMDRMDLLFPFEDEVDEEEDRAKAEHILDSWDESARISVGEEDVQQDVTDRPVPLDVFRAWLVYAREAVVPTLTQDAKDHLAEFYVDARDLNDGHSTGPSEEKTVPVTARRLEAGVRISIAFARVELSERVEKRHTERAISLSKKVVGLNYDPETGEFDAGRTDRATPKSQKERREALVDIVRELAGDDPALRDDVADHAAEIGIGRSRVGGELDAMVQSKRGPIYEPNSGEYRPV